MAWAATENFDSYTQGNDLNGSNSGSGWSGAWSADPSYDISATAFQGANGVQCASQNVDAIRGISAAVTDGIFHIAIRRSSLAAGENGVVLRDGGSSRIRITFTTTSIVLQNGAQDASVTLLTSPSVDTWYEAHVEIDAANDRARGRIDNDQWSAWLTVESYADIDDIRVTTGSTATGTFFIDDIREGSEPPAASPIRRRMMTGVGA